MSIVLEKTVKIHVKTKTISAKFQGSDDIDCFVGEDIHIGTIILEGKGQARITVTIWDAEGRPYDQLYYKYLVDVDEYLDFPIAYRFEQAGEYQVHIKVEQNG